MVSIYIYYMVSISYYIIHIKYIASQSHKEMDSRLHFNEQFYIKEFSLLALF